jgi:hypothetical protein
MKLNFLLLPFILIFKPIPDLPGWVLLLCVLAGLLYAALLYFRNGKDGFSLGQKRLFAVFRFLTVTLVAILLLGILVERQERYTEDPLILFVQDNSQSVDLAGQDVFDREAYVEEMAGFLESLDSRFDVRTYLFGESFRPAGEVSFGDRLTDISAVFDGIEGRYSNRNLGAVILASDGIYNRGIHPVYRAEGLPYPVYTLAMGDTMPRRDLILRRVNHNRLTYLDNEFPLEVLVEAREADGLNGQLRISREGEVVFSRDLLFSEDLHQETVSLHLPADRPGMQRYVAEILPVAGEVSTDNNRQVFYIEVIDGRQKVLILASAPHPDVGALHLALEESDRFEVTVALMDAFDGVPEAYNLVVLHQLPDRPGRLDELLRRLEAEGIPLLFVVGQHTDLDALNGLFAGGVSILPRSEERIEAQALVNQGFGLFAVSGQAVRLLQALPPLQVPFARYETSRSARVLAFQRIGQTGSGQPLIAFEERAGRKSGIITGEGIWRWRLAAHMRSGSHRAFDDLVSRMVQYLAQQEDKSLFRVEASRFFEEDQEVYLEAELYNRSFEPVNEPDVFLEITGTDGISHTYQMDRSTSAYRLSAGNFPPGDYEFGATTRFGGESYSASGAFTVLPLNLEGMQTLADHQLLDGLSSRTGGRMAGPGQWDDLAAWINGRDDLLPLVYSQRSYDPLIGFRAVFFLLLLLLAAEWFLRKRAGSY